jgi:hypothetical protein
MRIKQLFSFMHEKNFPWKSPISKVFQEFLFCEMGNIHERIVRGGHGTLNLHPDPPSHAFYALQAGHSCNGLSAVSGRLTSNFDLFGHPTLYAFGNI